MAMKNRARLRQGTKKTAKPVAMVSLATAPWDLGATGPANRRDMVIEQAADIDPETGEIINPNGIVRARKVDKLEKWYRAGKISAAGYNAAEKLRDAFEATQRAPGWPDNDRVQSSPKPDHAVTIHADRMSRFRAVNRYVAPADRPIIYAYVLDNLDVTSLPEFRGDESAGLAALSAALDRMADSLSGHMAGIRRLVRKLRAIK